jgi:hypothetical protein
MLTVRREVKNLNLFYKIINNEAPEYLSELIPPTVAESNNYNLRNRHNISQPANRLSSYQNSFFPSTIKTWNTLDLNIREVPTFFTLKCNKKCLAVSSDFPHEHNAFGIKLARYKSLFNALHLFLNLLCKTFKYLSPDEK